MSKRLTDTNKWEDPWFFGLTKDQRFLWMYLCDKCDNAGVINFNSHLAAAMIHHNFDHDMTEELKALGSRVRVLPNGKLLLPGFVRFQNGELKPTNNFHKSVLALIEKHGIGELLRGTGGASLPHEEEEREYKEEEEYKEEKKEEEETFLSKEQAVASTIAEPLVGLPVGNNGLHEVLDKWAARKNKPGAEYVSAKDRTAWEEALGVHGKAFCLRAIAAARRVDVGWAIRDHEKQEKLDYPGGRLEDLESEAE